MCMRPAHERGLRAREMKQTAKDRAQGAAFECAFKQTADHGLTPDHGSSLGALLLAIRYESPCLLFGHTASLRDD